MLGGPERLWNSNAAHLLKAPGELRQITGLPAQKYAADALRQMAQARTPQDLGALDVALSAAFLTYARDVQTGVLIHAGKTETLCARCLTGTAPRN